MSKNFKLKKMKLIKSLMPTILLSCITVFIFSCSQDLSRTKARDLIIKENKFKTFETVRIKTAYYSNVSQATFVDEIHGNYKNIKYQLQKMEQNGVVVLSEELLNEWEELYVLKVALTEEGKKYLIEKDGDFYFIVKSCEIAFGEITGIQVQDQFKVAEVNYTLVRKNPTPFGVSISQEPINKKAQFSLFDDGWRIDN